MEENRDVIKKLIESRSCSYGWRRKEHENIMLKVLLQHGKNQHVAR